MIAHQLINLIVTNYAKGTTHMEGSDLIEVFSDLWVGPTTDIQTLVGYKVFEFQGHHQVADKVIAEMDKQGYRPCAMFELLDYLAANKSYGNNCSRLVALGSWISKKNSWGEDSPQYPGFLVGSMCVDNKGTCINTPKLFVNDAHFHTNLDSCDPSEYGFLAVPKL